MLLKINKECGWRKVYLNLLDNSYELNDKILLQFNNNTTTVNIDLDPFKYYYLESETGYKTEVVILSENTEEITLKYNRKKKAYYIYLVDTFGYYGCASSFVLYDRKNLFFRKDKGKKIDILLPKNYDPNKSYGLLLAFDGQNIFDLNNSGLYTKKNDPYGSWQIDVSMSMLAKRKNTEYIIVGIEHTDSLRTNELLTDTSLFPLKDTNLLSESERVGLIDYLNNFINETLLPYLFNNYSIDKNNIGICGSSMGGMGAHYIGLKNLGLYHFILSFTPASALVVDEAWINFYKTLKFSQNLAKLPIFYFYQGNSGELEQMLYSGNLHLINNLKACGYPQHLIYQYVEQNADHNEIWWRYGFNYMIDKIH